MKTLIIIRGIPGAGKSTLAKAIEQSSLGVVEICEADQFFTSRNGTYNYVPRLVPAAHEWCRRKVESAMKREVSTVILSNTSCRTFRVEVYLDLATKYGYGVQQIVCFGTFGSIHGVPEDHMARFRDELRESLVLELEGGKLV